MKKFFLTSMVCLLCLLPLFARDISLEEALNLSIENNLSLMNSKITLENTKNDYKYSYNTLIPSINAQATFTRPNENTSLAVQNKLQGLPVPDPTWAFTVGISGQWTFNPAMITNIQVAKEDYLNGTITYEKAEQDLKKNVSKLYYGILLQEESLKIQQDNLKSKEARYKQAQSDYQNGYIPEISLLQSQVTYQNAIPSYQTALKDVKNSKRQLAMLLGTDIDDELVLTSSIEAEMLDISSDEALSGINNRFDLRLLDSSEKLAKLQKTALIESTFLPNLVLNASYQPYLYDISKSGSDYWVDTGSISGTVAWNISNLLPSSNGYKNLKNLNNSLEQISVNKELITDNARIEILNLLDTLDQTKSSLESSESTVSLAQASYNMRQKAYSEGFSDYLDLIDAETQLNQAKLSRLSNQYNYISALIDLEYATGNKYLNK